MNRILSDQQMQAIVTHRIHYAWINFNLSKVKQNQVDIRVLVEIMRISSL